MSCFLLLGGGGTMIREIVIRFEEQIMSTAYVDEKFLPLQEWPGGEFQVSINTLEDGAKEVCAVSGRLALLRSPENMGVILGFLEDEGNRDSLVTTVGIVLNGKFWFVPLTPGEGEMFEGVAQDVVDMKARKLAAALKSSPSFVGFWVSEDRVVDGVSLPKMPHIKDSSAIHIPGYALEKLAPQNLTAEDIAKALEREGVFPLLPNLLPEN